MKDRNQKETRKNISRMTLAVIMTVVLSVMLAGCGKSSASGTKQGGDSAAAASSKSLEKVTVVLDWTPNTNHTGIYVAKELGYYKKAGLDVNIIQPGKVTAETLVANGKADFGISDQENVTEARVQGVPLVSLAAVIQHNTSGFASPVDRNITSPKDFEGKTYGGWGSPQEKAVIQSLMETQNADVNKVNIVNIGDTDFFTAVQRKQIDFAWIFYGWTGIQAKLKNIPLNIIYLNKFSKKLDYYTPVLVTNEKHIKNKPKLVKSFMKATSDGYDYAIANPDKAANLLIKAVPDLDPKLVTASQEWLSKQYQADASKWGEQKASVWQGYADWMHTHKLLKKVPDISKAYTNKFLP